MSRRKSVSFCSEMNLQKKGNYKTNQTNNRPRLLLIQLRPSEPQSSSGGRSHRTFFHRTSCFQQHFSVKVCDGRGGKSRRDARGRRRMADLMAFLCEASGPGEGGGSGWRGEGSGGDGVPGHEQHSSLFFFFPPATSTCELFVGAVLAGNGSRAEGVKGRRGRGGGGRTGDERPSWLTQLSPDVVKICQRRPRPPVFQPFQRQK